MNVFFKKGIPGFEELKKFTIDDLEGNDKFKLIQSEEEISFVAVNPFDIYTDYEINLNDETIKELEIESPNDVLVLSILTLGKTLEETTMNLKAPIVVNIKNNLGKQFILQSEDYQTKHPLIRREDNVSSY
ncbi:flagellar assembly protein FliW [Romboutsia sp.]|uniref:flagellar assembly protein FliW n=1 Tax=Romboutsia sp. TaxID=1965302 RepID=UPI003F35AD0A